MYATYPYVGSPDHYAFAILPSTPSGTPIHSHEDLVTWIHTTRPKPDAQGVLIATFVIRQDGVLLLADRHSEHIACANGQRVLSAGEIGFIEEALRVFSIETLTNQSTGFCPDITSWDAVSYALQYAKLHAPPSWTTPFLFRRCPSCNATNIVKDQWFVCALCEHDLPKEWNYVKHTHVI